MHFNESQVYEVTIRNMSISYYGFELFMQIPLEVKYLYFTKDKRIFFVGVASLLCFSNGTLWPVLYYSK